MNLKLLRASNAKRVVEQLIFNNMPLFSMTPGTSTKSGGKRRPVERRFGKLGAKTVSPRGTRKISLLRSDRREKSGRSTGHAETKAESSSGAVFNICQETG